jgi:hypothetical protein
VGDATIVDVDEEGSSDEGKKSPTPKSIAKTKRHDGRKYAKEKGKKEEDDEIKESLDSIM